jgi:transposase
VERSEAEAIYAQGREPVVDVLLVLSARLEAQDAQLAALAERVEGLEQRLKRDSRNSSLPPSHDPPWLGKRGRSRGTGRKQGAQPGHPGHGRALFPIERVTDVVDHWPERCGCGHVFGGEECEPAGAPARHQVAELPPLAVEISEHRLQRVCCPECGRTVRAELPSGVPRGCFGPKLEAAIASLTVRNRLSRRQLVELMEELFGCPIAVGTIDAILTRTAATLEPVYEELLEQTRSAGALNIDETGWYLSGEARTLWGAFSKQTAVVRIAPDRGKQHLHGLIGDGFAGVVGSDRFSAYNSLGPEQRQVCWSHLRRDFTFHADLGQGAQETFGLDGLEVTWNVFQAWKQFQHDGDRAALRRRVEQIKDQMWPLLEWGSTGKRQRHVRSLAKNLLKLWPALFRTAALRRPNLPATAPLPLRLPQRRSHREIPWRPDSSARLSNFSARKLHKRLHTGPLKARPGLNTYQKAPICGGFAEPSDGLEPSTPSLPWRFRGVTRVHVRSLATQFFLQIGPSEESGMRRETSRVSFLMCPFCVRGQLLT